MGLFQVGNQRAANKMTAETVEEMFVKRESGWTIKRIAEHFGLNEQHAGKILRGESWKEVYQRRYGAGGPPKMVEEVPPAKRAVLDDIFADALELQKRIDAGEKP